jgi:threonylcarbamoyladenosine tRNA methylthiotransferase MtaB
LHVPLQAGDDDVLKRMRRKYTTAQFSEKMAKVREALPGVALTTDVIVGFPGETEEQFENSYRFIQKIGFAEMHVFPYSMRTGTPAARMPNQIPEEVKHQRVAKLLELNKELQLAYSSQFVGEVLEVIPERSYKEAPDSGQIMGYSDNYLNVVFPGDESMIGKICKVRLDEPGTEYCRGTFVRVLDHNHQLPAKERAV